MKIKFLILYFLFSISLVSCNKEKQLSLVNEDYLIFGRFYGECLGENCVKIYKLTSSNLFHDKNNNYINLNFDFESMNSSDFEKVKDLTDYFPEQLLSERVDVIGCPDCYDQGGIFIQLSQNGEIKSWRIDNDKKNIPSYLHTFVDKVHEKIDLLNP